MAFPRDITRRGFPALFHITTAPATVGNTWLVQTVPQECYNSSRAGLAFTTHRFCPAQRKMCGNPQRRNWVVRPDDGRAARPNSDETLVIAPVTAPLRYRRTRRGSAEQIRVLLVSLCRCSPYRKH